ncbi:MAG: type I-U CRISPR-associated protein Cas7 [Gemmataceae bacterium]|nr:type I-U CRISPR-associated protein Cas7 [Gemmataceae bacterium]
MPTTSQPLTLDQLKQAVRGSAAAVRLRVKLQPAGGAGTKVFPPTYSGGQYAWEPRLIDGQPVECVLLDSVQSQANRLEQALLQAYRDGKMKFPLIGVAFGEFPDIGEITTLDAPHRVFDAILRDSTLNGVPFRPQVKAKAEEDKGDDKKAKAKTKTAAKPGEASSVEGSEIALANVRYATPLLGLCPTALVFGAWDSTGAAGGLGNKFARAIVSEIVGVQAVRGVRTSSRLDPLGIEKGEIYESAADGSFVVHAAEARQEKAKVKEEGKDKEIDVPALFKRKTADKGKPSEINHGNVTPDIVKNDDGELTGGGVTVAHAEQITVLSLAALRRLRFPPKPGEASKPEADLAARTVLAALALAAVAHQMDPPDYFLRSNCQLVLESEPVFELVVTASNTQSFALSADAADALFAEAVAELKGHGLPWREDKIVLTPKKALVDLVKRSRELGGEE